MPTLILTPRFTEDAQALWRAAVSLGWSVERLQSWRVPEHVLQVEEPVLYLEGMFAPTLAEQFGLQLLEPPMDWLPQLPLKYPQREIVLSTMGEARQLKKKAFIKPPNEKSFKAAVYEPDQLPDDYDDEMPVLISDIVNWDKEFRCFILDRECQTISVYLRDGELQREAEFKSTDTELGEAQAFLSTVLNDESVELPRACVIDVGVIKGTGWAVIEQNAAWGSGIYGCDPKAVLEVIRHAAVEVNET